MITHSFTSSRSHNHWRCCLGDYNRRGDIKTSHYEVSENKYDIDQVVIDMDIDFSPWQLFLFGSQNFRESRFLCSALQEMMTCFMGFAKYTTKIAKYTTQILTRLKKSNTRQFAKYMAGFTKYTTTQQKLTLKGFDH